MAARGIRQYIDRKVLGKAGASLLIGLGIATVIVVEYLRGEIAPVSILAGGLTGFATGIALSRSRHLEWSAEERKVMAHIDWAGATILVLYMLLVLNREWLFGHWVSVEQLAKFSLCFTAGTMFGRVRGTRLAVRRVVRKVGGTAPRQAGTSQAERE